MSSFQQHRLSSSGNKTKQNAKKKFIFFILITKNLQEFNRPKERKINLTLWYRYINSNSYIYTIDSTKELKNFFVSPFRPIKLVNIIIASTYKDS